MHKCVLVGYSRHKKKTTFIGGMELVSLCCNRDFTSASSYGLGWYKYAIASQWYQFHTTDAWWFFLNICIYSYISSFWHNIFAIPPAENSGISKSTGWAIIEELSIRRRVRTFLVSWGQTTCVKNCYVDLSSSYELWFPIIFIDMNVIFYHNPPILETVSIASMCQHGPHGESFFFLLKYNNSNSSTGECVWINGEQNSQRQNSVQQHWHPKPQAESRQLAVNTWVLGSILRACLFVIRL